MSDHERYTASPRYALGQLERALEKAASAGDAAARKRAGVKAEKWRAVVDGMAGGQLSVGSRTPVADTPAWVTLEVVHGGFATGRYLAETPLRDDEVARLASVPEEVPGTTDRERLNLWYLSDEGQAELVAALSGERYRVDVPEDAALMVVAWLLDTGHYEDALDLVAQLRPLMHRLRLTPRFEPVPRPSGATVRLEPVGDVRKSLRNRQVNPQIGAMLETLRVWHPLFDRLVALWCETVGGDLPHLSDESDEEAGSGGRARGTVRGTVRGGWPCRAWPEGWADRRRQWLADYRSASLRYGLSRRHLHPKGNFFRLRTALEQCEYDSRDLSAREVGWIRRALANTITKHGAPGSETRAALRAAQASVAARPTHATLAQVVAGRLDRYPDEGGIPSIDPIAADVEQDEADGVPPGYPIPSHLVTKATRALEAPIEELVDRGVIGSGEVLARVLPQVTADLVAGNVDDPRLAALYARTYAAFRRRRSLLLLNLEHHIQFEELPWISVLGQFRPRRSHAARGAREALRQTTLLALRAFPYAILPNPLVRELGALATQAEVPMPLVEEVAADIFMGTFTMKWREAAVIASERLAGSLYARYYDLPGAGFWTNPRRRGRVLDAATGKWGKNTADDFADLCAWRAEEAHVSPRSFGGVGSVGVGGVGGVAANGAVLEQSQILTTHNLAVLLERLRLRDQMGELAPGLADRTLTWVVRRQSQPIRERFTALQMVKNCAYAWRQAIFFLSLCDQATQLAAVARLRDSVADARLETRLGPAVDGLAHVVSGERFNASGKVDESNGRRFLGWSVGPHWCLAEDLPR